MLVYVLYAPATPGLTEEIWIEYAMLAVALFAMLLGYFFVIRTVRMVYRRVIKRAS